MGKAILLLRLEGPLQSWGVRSRWDVRDSATEPTKSGIIGLLGCALGYPMRDARLQNLDQSLRFGVRIEHAGAMLTDYQTITDFLPTAASEWKGRGDKRSKSLDTLRDGGAQPATIISPRTYLEDAAFLVALEARAESDGKVLWECAGAVQRPIWPLFLGRKSCIPTRPIFEYYGEDYRDIEDAFARHRWEWLGTQGKARRRATEQKLAALIESENGEIPIQDVTQMNAARTYGFRRAQRTFFDAVPAIQSTLEPGEVV